MKATSVGRKINLKKLCAVTSLLFLISHQLLIPTHNAEKYIIGQHGWGFFSCFLGTLNQLFSCEIHNKTPVVYWDKTSLYYEENGFNGCKNVWEYYFEPVSSLSFVHGDCVHNVYPIKDIDFSQTYTHTSSINVNYRGINKNYPYQLIISVNPTSLHRMQAHRLISSYIKIKPCVQKKIDHFYQQYMNGKKTIGIHLRGTDKHIEAIPICPEKMIEIALGFADEATQFLIATDEQSLLFKAISLLRGRKVIYYDCYRSPNNSPLHGLGKIKNAPQNLALSNDDTILTPCLAQLGEDVLVEASLLAKCNLFIHTLSNVSTAVCYLNSTLKNVLITMS